MGLQNLVKSISGRFCSFQEMLSLLLMLIFRMTSSELCSLKTGHPATAAGSLFAIYCTHQKGGTGGEGKLYAYVYCIMALVPLAVFFNFITKFYEV